MKKLSVLLLLMISLFQPAFAEGEGWGEVDAATQAQMIRAIEGYLKNLNSLKASFTQVAPNGNIATGEFFLKQPAKMRWAYDPPVPILMISNGDYLTYIDYEMDQVSHLPLGDEILDFLKSPTLSADHPEVRMTSFRSGANLVAASFVQTEAPDDGHLTLEFTQNPVSLVALTMIDQTGQVTRVMLDDVKHGMALDNELFVFKDPRKGRRIKR